MFMYVMFLVHNEASKYGQWFDLNKSVLHQ